MWTDGKFWQKHGIYNKELNGNIRNKKHVNEIKNVFDNLSADSTQLKKESINLSIGQ